MGLPVPLISVLLIDLTFMSALLIGLGIIVGGL
jgi:hypothetical protein